MEGKKHARKTSSISNNIRRDNKSISCLSEIQQINEEAANVFDVVNDTGINECFKMMEKLDQIEEEKP